MLLYEELNRGYRRSIKYKHSFICALVRHGCAYDCTELHRAMHRGDSDSSSIVHLAASACLSLISEYEASDVRHWPEHGHVLTYICSIYQ